jgi:hypothetical protein
MNACRVQPLLPAMVYVLLSALVAQPTGAQGVTTGAVSGTVRDADGRPLQEVRMSVLDGRTGAAARVFTNRAGRYLVPHLQPGGPYAVEVWQLGYRPAVRRDVWIALGQTTSLDFELEPVPIELPALTVVPANPLFSRSRTGPETTLQESEIGDLPTIGRQITDYAILSPHVVTVRDGPSVGGQNFRFNNIRIDGAVSHDLFGLTDTGIPGGEGNAKAISVEAIEELQILAAPFDVRHSGFTGGLINAVTRSGTNRWEGSAFGYHTNEAWLSELDGEPATEFTDTQIGWTLGGPLRRENLFLFTASEFQIQRTPAPGPSFVAGGPLDDGARAAGIHPDSARRFIDLLEGFGFKDVGTTGEIPLRNPRANLFARLDFVPSDRTRLVLRHNYSRARADQPPVRGLDEFRLSSAGRSFTGNTHSTIAHHFARLGERWHNEAILNVQFVRLDRQPMADFPLVQVEVTSEIDGESLRRRLAAGAEPQAQAANALEQDILQLTDHVTGVFGRHQITIGTHAELFRFRHRFFPQALGTFRFASLADLEANSPSLYTVNTIRPGTDDPAAVWSLLSVSGYAQDAWSVNDRLTVNLGVRVDVPVFLDGPRANPTFEQAFGFTNARSPKARPRIQPRLGVNWRAGGTYMTQVRGGVGLFAGRPSFVWLSNAFSNTGHTFAFLVCPGPVAPRLNAADYPESPPQRCADGSPPSPDLATVDITDPDFAFPLDLKLSFGLDRELPHGFSVTAEGLYSRAVDQAFLEELNLVENPVGFDATQGSRPLFGTPSADGFEPVRKTDEFAHVVRLTNRSGGRALLLSFGLQRRMEDWLRLRGSYTYADVKERQALFFPLAPWGFAGNPIRGNPNDPELATSPFERRHTVVVSATARRGLGGFELSLTPQYFANSGVPYSYTVEGDVNGDGYRSARITRDNDLIYVPNDASEVSFRNPAHAAAFVAFIESEPCLRAQRGRLMKPYSCFGPWQQRWDLRAVIGKRGGGGRAEIVFDVINLFAHRFEQPLQTDRGISVLRLAGRVDGDSAAPLLFDFLEPAERAAVFERLRPQSQRWFQAGLRYRF